MNEAQRLAGNQSMIGLSKQLWKLCRAAVKSAGAQLRRAGLLGEHADWQRRAEICERCPMRVVVDRLSYCGPPLLNQLERDPAIDGCGCPILHKARTPQEHCPVDGSYHAAAQDGGQCNCKWCAADGIDSDP